ncbi:MAG: hypothetical protein DYG92_05685 [Leptolyngbya sp. PLA1]|nr:hypothetical protein [Leptolyngbya sp. PLA1]
MHAARKNPVRHRRELSLFAMACGGFALLIWFKLRMVTGVPRTAYADPDPPEPPAPRAPAQPGASATSEAPAPEAR